MQAADAAASGLADPRGIVAAAFNNIRPPARITVSAAAEKHRFIRNKGAYVGRWQNGTTPFLVEPQDRVRERRWSLVALFGPPQFGKSELLLNVITHAGMEAPADMLLFLPTRDMAIDFASLRIRESLLLPNPAIRRELSDSVGADRILRKVFRKGATLTVAWPSGTELASRPTPYVLLDEFESMPLEIGDEGSPDEMADNRTTTFKPNSCVVITSSFKRSEYLGAIVVFDSGTRCLWFWKCQDCGEYWSVGFDAERKQTFAHLRYPEGAEVNEAWLVCPCCGSIVQERDKAAMNATGRWVPAGQTIDQDGNLVGPEPTTTRATYWFCALASPFVTWLSLARDYAAALAHKERTRTDSKLRAVYNRFGFRFVPDKADEAQLVLQVLKDRGEDYPLGVVPPGAVALMAAVDVQAYRFVVLVRAFAVNGESWVVDRFELFQSPDGSRALDPANYLSDWQVLVPGVIERVYPLAVDPERCLPVLSTAIDTGGRPGVTGNSYKFSRQMRQDGLPDRRLLLVKGDKNVNGPPVNLNPIEKDAQGRPLKYGVHVGILNVKYLKDEIFAGLTKQKVGPDYIHLPNTIADHVLEELTVERRNADGVWERTSSLPNELWDLIVYTLAAWIRLGGERINWDSPPGWIRQAQAMPEEPPPEPAVPATPDRERIPAASPAAVPVVETTVPRASARIIGLTKPVATPTWKLPKQTVTDAFD